jgi:protein required for attachment to host cells
MRGRSDGANPPGEMPDPERSAERRPERVGGPVIAEERMMTRETWVVVADGAGARLLRAHRPTRRLELLREERHPEGRAKPSDLVSDRPGRSLDSSHAGQRHAMEPDTDPRRVELHRFVQHLARELEAASSAAAFDSLVLVAAPRVLGELRSVLPPSVAGRVEQEVAKDLAGFDLKDLEKHLAPFLWPD